MAKTYKRTPLQFGFDLKNYTKYFNHLDFKGIVHQNNVFEIDQQSLKDAVNVYRDENNILVSREPLIREELPVTYRWVMGVLVASPIILEDYNLVNIVEKGLIVIYVSQHITTKKYRIVAKYDSSNIIAEIPYLVDSYHISAINNYIVVFNNVGARVIEANQLNILWRPLEDFVEIPVTKRIVGQDIFEYPDNKFTKSHKEEYIWSKEVVSMLPEGDALVNINQSPSKLTWTLPNANINTEFRILRTLRQKMLRTDIITTATNIDGIQVMCIAKPDYVLISLTNGLTFDKVLYPDNTGFLNIASVSKDGSSFFFVAIDGVYRYTIGDDIWIVISLENSVGNPIEFRGFGNDNICCFNSPEVFSFILFDDSETIRVYAKSPNLLINDGGELGTTEFSINTIGYYVFRGQVNKDSQLNLTRRDCSRYSLYIDMPATGVPTIAAWVVGNYGYSIVISIVGNINPLTPAFALISEVPMFYGMIYKAEQGPTTIDGISFKGVSIVGLTLKDGYWYHFEGVVGAKLDDGVYDNYYNEFDWIQNTEILSSTNGAPFKLGGGYITNKTTYSIDGIANIPEELLSYERIFTISQDNNYYILLDDTLYTTNMLINNNAVLTYTFIEDTPFTEVPNLSHANNELYLAFDDTLRITANHKIGEDFKFNLPIINDHSFISTITGIITISSTEVSIFLLDRIYLVTQVPDEIFGYRYDYYNTRLSNGIRLGDSLINSKNGVHTFYPTDQGLAVMNYQQDVAATDQIVEYLTTNITDIWTDFYKDSSKIILVQLKDYIYISNGTNLYLMLDLRTMTWWKFEIPMDITQLIVNNSELKIISGELYKFSQEQVIYKDLGVGFIDWKIESQLLHFGLPTHYKNMKQIIYQLQESTDITQTILSQIKIYRKQITYKEPEVISFKIDGYKTHIQRFNYWKINELQWALAADRDTTTPAQLRLNGLTIKYELAEEVRN